MSGLLNLETALAPIQAMGALPDDLSWCGLFIGPNTLVMSAVWPPAR